MRTSLPNAIAANTPWALRVLRTCFKIVSWTQTVLPTGHDITLDHLFWGQIGPFSQNHSSSRLSWQVYVYLEKW